MHDGCMNAWMDACIKSSNHNFKIFTKQLFWVMWFPCILSYIEDNCDEPSTWFQPTWPRHVSRSTNKLTFFFLCQSLKMFIIINQSWNLITSEWFDKNTQRELTRTWTTRTLSRLSLFQVAPWNSVGMLWKSQTRPAALVLLFLLI